MISCVCVTHGRHWVLEEAVECYLRQEDCGEPTELVILSDCPEQELVCDAPGVRIVNTRRVYSNVSQKFNAGVHMADGDYIAWWEDDDISLPWRLRMSRQRIGDAVAYKQGRAWYWDWGLKGLHFNLFFGSSLFRKDAFQTFGGAKDDCPADQSSWATLQEAGTALDEIPHDSECYWMYRWGGVGVHHDSGVAGTNEDRFAAFRRNTLANPMFRTGRIVLAPKWHKDYTALTRRYLEEHA